MPNEVNPIPTIEAPFTVTRIEELVNKRLDEERPKLTTSIRQEFQVQFDASVSKKEAELQENNRLMMEQVVAEFKKSQTPPTPKEIQEVLDQEYINFPVTIRWKDGQPEEISIGELPAATERKIVKVLKEKIGPIIKQFTPGLISVLQGETEDKVSALIELIDPAGDVMVDLLVIILETHSGHTVTREQVESSLSFTRQVSILSAQLEANRLRDFFSRVVRMSR